MAPVDPNRWMIWPPVSIPRTFSDSWEAYAWLCKILMAYGKARVELRDSAGKMMSYLEVEWG